MTEQRKNILADVGKHLSASRKSAGFSRSKASKLLNISEHTLYSYEKGRREFDVAIGLDMAKLYNVTFEKLTNYKKIAEALI